MTANDFKSLLIYKKEMTEICGSFYKEFEDLLFQNKIINIKIVFHNAKIFIDS